MIETERLILRPLTLDDAPVLQELMDDPSISEELPAVAHPLPPGGAEAWIRDALQDPTFALIARQGLEQGKIVGVIGIHLEDGNRGAIGGWVAREWRHSGYAVDALRACVRYGYEVIGLTTVYMFRKGRLWVAPADFGNRHLPFERDTTAGQVLNEAVDGGPTENPLARAGRRLSRLLGRG